MKPLYWIPLLLLILFSVPTFIAERISTKHKTDYLRFCMKTVQQYGYPVTYSYTRCMCITEHMLQKYSFTEALEYSTISRETLSGNLEHCP